ncbi:MAG: fibronectin type III domain-containing protein [Ruminococcus sp.]|nr:fibronectin type III domain-containing protein [Ruminococcus sp.]
MRNLFRKTITALLGLTFIYSAAASTDFGAKADDPTVLVTEYADLWNSSITVKAGKTVKWYVNVPEGTEPKGCGATVKIPELGLGTDSNDKEDKHITLVQGENFIYEFTPEKEGDILFNCWMGSGCHHNYIHVTSDGTYNADKPSDATDVSANRSGSTVEVSFTAPDAPKRAQITGYKVIATDENGKRRKAVVKESPAVFEELDEAQAYSFKVITLATSGDSAGENEFKLNAVSSTGTSEPLPVGQKAAASDQQRTDTTTSSTTTVNSAPIPETGDSSIEAAEFAAVISLIFCFALRKNKKSGT